MRANDKPFILGLTGGIACGKSAASEYLKTLGAAVVDADEISHALTAKDGAALPAILAQFGGEVFAEDGTLNREALAEEIFGDVEKKRRLEAILHPAIQKEALRQMDQAYDEGKDLVVLDVPLLYETGMDALCDEVWVLSVDRQTQIERIMTRDGKTRRQAEARIDSQMPLTEKEKRATRVIHTDKAQEETWRELHQLYKELTKKL